jgi:hypothetical protein
MTFDSLNFSPSASDPGPGTTRNRYYSLSVNLLYEPAFGRKYSHLRKGWASKMLCDWDTDGIWIVNTRDSFFSRFPGDDASGAPFSAQRSDWFTTAGFVATLAVASKEVF